METADLLQRKIQTAEELRSVVKNLKTIAAVSIGPYEKAVEALADYSQTVELGLIACLRQFSPRPEFLQGAPKLEYTGIVVFGSDQGMVGQFNAHLAEFVHKELDAVHGQKTIWPIGERIHADLSGGPYSLEPPAPVPDSVHGITPLIGHILLEIEQRREVNRMDQVLLFHNRPNPRAGYTPVRSRLLPLDQLWLSALQTRRWPTKLLPQIRRETNETFAAVLREYLFVSMFRNCAESLASENAARLAAMQGAEDNINRLLEQLHTAYNQERQNTIDAELFEVVSGYEAISRVTHKA